MPESKHRADVCRAVPKGDGFQKLLPVIARVQYARFQLATALGLRPLSVISSFSENIREILGNFHQNFTEKLPKFIDQNRNEMKFHFIPPKKFDDFELEF